MPGADTVEIPGYDDLVEIGRGGFAVVYRARQVRLQRLVAVKVLTGTDTSDAALERFERECGAVGALSGHPNVVAVHDAGTTADGRPYLAMELVAGGTLAHRLAEGPLPVDEVLAVGARLADALAAAHAAGVLHRDVKPENVLLSDDGTPKLADFGIAMVADTNNTATGVVLGTVLHAAPEVLTGARATPASDVYSLASTMDALLRGRAAFAGAAGEGPIPVMYRAVHERAPDLRQHGIPDEVARLVEAGMAKDPAARVPDARTFGQRIQAVRDHRAGGQAPTPMPHVVVPAPAVAGATVAAAPPAAVTRTDAGPDRGRAGLVVGLVAALLVLAAVVAGIVVVLTDGDDDQATPTTTTPVASSTEASSTASSSSSSTTTTTTTAPTTTTTSTTTSTTAPTTTTAPVASDEAEAAALIGARYPSWTVVDSTGFRASGAGAVVGEDGAGRRIVFLFGGGRLIGTDTSEPSLGLVVVGVGGNDVRIGYDTWPAGSGPPDPPTGYAEVLLRWPGTDQFLLQEGVFPPTDPATADHR
ncbi:protein kinase [Iamia sp. SCSIO 61187]|uniref:protein kinase domain-containing protein n=1 Tax=Iamia sp. SCSIO 61187 TaxID=2722752 RepID=UPI001C63948E|nr:protein kinase [Iamia sp. SCSIO 61187]QYG94099.1 protein kinase [Iamia sp. SCSIO 61187]